MRFLDRFRNDREAEGQDPAPEGVGGVAPGGGQLGELRMAAQELLAAGADAINKTLSRDSETYLASTRQEGGQ